MTILQSFVICVFVVGCVICYFSHYCKVVHICNVGACGGRCIKMVSHVIFFYPSQEWFQEYDEHVRLRVSPCMVP